MSDALAAMDPGGKASIISYNVPEPTSYSGKNFIEIPLPDAAFQAVVPLPATLASGAERLEGPTEQPALADRRTTTAAVVAPDSVMTGRGRPDASPVLTSPLPKSERLRELTNREILEVAERGGQTILYPDVSGQLNYRTVSQDGGGGGPVGGGNVEVPAVYVTMDAPNANEAFKGTAAGAGVAVYGKYTSERIKAGTLRVTVSVLALATAKADLPGTQQATLDPGTGTWRTTLTVTSSGSFSVIVKIVGTGYNSKLGRDVTVSDTESVPITVKLDAGNLEPPPVLPTVSITKPENDSTFVSQAETTTVEVAGTTTVGAGRSLKQVAITDSVTGKTDLANRNTDGTWSVPLALSSRGDRTVTVVATDDLGSQSHTQRVAIRIVAEQPFRRIANRLFIVETLNLSSFLGAFGAGRVIKTFSLLPGEKTTISFKSWKKSTETSKSGSSIVDSDATEAASDFEDTLNSEQTRKDAQSEATNYKLEAKVGASWGFGSASINADYSGSANASREEAVKNVKNAVRKHSMKASANRSVTVNTEFTATREEGQEESTTREITNINVSRTLNFVFRQMNQEHITLIHLTNVRVAFYTEDSMLDTQGNPAYVVDPNSGKSVLDIRPHYVEVTLPDLDRLLAQALVPDWQGKVRTAIVNALSAFPDYQDEARTVFERVIPTRDGKPVAEAEYMRFPRNLTTDFVDPTGRATSIKGVPGIVLGYDYIVMRTDGVMVDTLLGQGDGLDEYSHKLQQVAIAEREAAVREREAEVARQRLARQLVTKKDKTGADIFAKLFAPPGGEDEATPPTS